jgi:hypothetical protein
MWFMALALFRVLDMPAGRSGRIKPHSVKPAEAMFQVALAGWIGNFALSLLDQTPKSDASK